MYAVYLENTHNRTEVNKINFILIKNYENKLDMQKFLYEYFTALNRFIYICELILVNIFINGDY